MSAESLPVARSLRASVAIARQAVVGVVIVVEAQSELLQIVDALGASSRLSRRLNGRQQKRNQDANNGNNDQQFDKGKASSSSWYSYMENVCVRHLSSPRG